MFFWPFSFIPFWPDCTRQVEKPNRLKVAPQRGFFEVAPLISASEWNFLRTHLSPSGPFGPFAEVLKPNRLKVAPHRHILTLAPALSASEWNFCALFILALLHFGPYFSAHQQFQGQIACHVR